MPKKVEQALKKVAKKKGLKGEELGAFIYGTMRNQVWKPKKKK